VSTTVRPPRGTEKAPPARIAHLSIPKAGEQANGDRVIVRHGAGGQMLVGVIDALGHGVGAEEVAMAADALLSSAPLELGVGALMEQVHHALRGSRGAAATLCIVSGGRLEACGVGNVDLRCAETDLPFVFSPGILGSRVQRFRVAEARMAPATRLIFFSDGIGPVGRIEDLRKLPPQDACRILHQRHRRSEDDATVLIADLG
jgi:negative regulator of sigma-B (phosphoserine phosphatase)